MSWRPRDWGNPVCSELTRSKRLWSRWENLTPEELKEDAEYCAYEAGADAILEALIAKATFMSPSQMKLLAPDREHPYGWLVFIEETE